MMVDIASQSVLAEFEENESYELPSRTPTRTAARFAINRREQSSRIKQATQSRYSRKRSAKSNAPTGPRRRFRKG